MKQINRICKKGTVCCYVIDYWVHLRGALNHFRFFEKGMEKRIVLQDAKLCESGFA